MQLSTAIRKQLQAALEQRYAEVSDLVSCEKSFAPKTPTPEAEEKLRILMTQYFPKFRQYENEILLLIEQLAPFSLSNDLRFLDAFNNLYDLGFRHSKFLLLYRFVLRNYLKEH